MKFGVREICDVVLKAKANQKVGNKIFYKGEPVIYFDTLKTSSMEGAATTVYAQGGRGNSRLVAWEGERTITFTMEDALISPAGFMILSGAGLIEASADESVIVHATEQTDKVSVSSDGKTVTINLNAIPYIGKDKDGASLTVDKEGTNYSTYDEDLIYVMVLDGNGEVSSEPFIPTSVKLADDEKTAVLEIKLDVEKTSLNGRSKAYKPYSTYDNQEGAKAIFKTNSIVLVDYYIEKKTGAQQIDITPDKFGGNYYLEASTLFRTTDGVDMPAEFIIPNCKIQSNFTFTMASSGDPSSFTFTMDAFPDYTRFNKTKKVLAAIQIVDEGTGEEALRRASTYAHMTHEESETSGAIVEKEDKAPNGGSSV